MYIYLFTRPCYFRINYWSEDVYMTSIGLGIFLSVHLYITFCCNMPVRRISLKTSRVKVNDDAEMWYTSRTVGKRLLNNIVSDVHQPVCQGNYECFGTFRCNKDRYYENNNIQVRGKFVFLLSGLLWEKEETGFCHSTWQSENCSDRSGTIASLLFLAQPKEMPLSPITHPLLNCLNLTNTHIYKLSCFVI